MKTYQDLLALGDNEKRRMDFVRDAVNDHRSSDAYKNAKVAEAYYARRNVTMNQYRKVIRDVMGQAHEDVFSANYKLTSGFFRRFVLQQTQYILSNGATFEKDAKEKLGPDFDSKLSRLAKKALVDGVGFGFWNFDHLEVFGLADTDKEPGFAPLYDDETGLLCAGVRYWSPSGTETMRYTLYEIDGITEYIHRKNEDITTLNEKKPYVRTTVTTERGGVEEETGENYPGFPIIPMYANDIQESELLGIRSGIDCYDFVKSGMANNVDEASAFYWTLKNTGGMDDMDLQRFVERMKVVKAAVLDDGVEAQAHTISVPVDANEKLLNRLRADLYEDVMLMDVQKALSGNMTATAIRLAYQPQDDKCGDFEFYIRDFIASLLKLLDIEDEPSFRWNRIANQTEETNMVMTAAAELGTELTLKKLPFLTPEEVEQRMKEIAAEGDVRFNAPPTVDPVVEE